MIPASPWLHTLHDVDYSWLLPMLARLPLSLAYHLASARGHINAWLGKDWRSMALARHGFRQHIARRTIEAYREMLPDASERELAILAHQRFHAEAMEEFEGALIYEGRVDALECEFVNLPQRDTGRGLLLLTAHYGSFVLGYSFLARLGWVINVMATGLVAHPEIPVSVQRHFRLKYLRSQDRFHGGRVIYFEQGVQPALHALRRGECLGVQADSPPTGKDAKLTVPFVLGLRRLASGGVRCARLSDAQVVAYLCERIAPGRYRVRFSAIGEARDVHAVESAYRFLGEAIRQCPAQWWAADLLPAMPRVAAT